MFRFSEYLKLSRETKSLATRYWVACIKSHLDALSAYQIRQLILSDEEKLSKNKGWLTNSSRFWNHKEGGEPVIREHVVDEIEKKISGTKSLLCHPLWQLIDNHEPTRASVKLILEQLPTTFREKLFFENPATGSLTRKKKLTRSQYSYIIYKNDLNSLTCFLAFCLENKEYENNGQLNLDQLEALKIFIYLAICTPFKEIASDINKLIQSRFSHFYHHYPQKFRTEQYYVDKNKEISYVPLGFIHQDCSLLLDSCISLYHQLLELAVENNLIDKSEKERNAFIYILNLTEIQELTTLLIFGRREKIKTFNRDYKDFFMGKLRRALSNKQINFSSSVLLTTHQQNEQ